MWVAWSSRVNSALCFLSSQCMLNDAWNCFCNKIFIDSEEAKPTQTRVLKLPPSKTLSKSFLVFYQHFLKYHLKHAWWICIWIKYLFTFLHYNKKNCYCKNFKITHKKYCLFARSLSLVESLVTIGDTAFIDCQVKWHPSLIGWRWCQLTSPVEDCFWLGVSRFSFTASWLAGQNTDLIPHNFWNSGHTTLFVGSNR